MRLTVLVFPASLLATQVERTGLAKNIYEDMH